MRAVSDEDAGWWVAAGLGQILVGLVLLGLEEPFLSTMWGIALLITGGSSAIVGVGVLLRLWR